MDCVGIAAEIAPMNPRRVRYHDGGADLAAEVLIDADATIDRVAVVGHGVTTSRAAQLGDDTWPSRLLLVDAADPETPALPQLLHLVVEHPGGTVWPPRRAGLAGWFLPRRLRGLLSQDGLDPKPADRDRRADLSEREVRVVSRV